MNHKRMTSWLLAAGVMVSLAGCGSQTPVQEVKVLEQQFRWRR